MSSSETFKSEIPINKASIPKAEVLENETLGSKTPEKKLQQLRRGARKSCVALSIEQVRRAAAKSLFKKTQKAADEIASWPDEIPKETRVRRSVKLPEKYEVLGEFFNSLDISIRRLRKKGLKSIFANIGPAIEYLTDRRFTYSHLAQLKFVLPEVIEIKKVIMWDERARSRKPDLHVTMNVNAVGNDGKLKSDVGGGIMHLRRAFRKQLADISKSHPEDYEIPEETLPHPFNSVKQHYSDGVKFLSSSCPCEASTCVHTVEQPAVSIIGLQGDDSPDEMHPMTSNHSKEDLNNNIKETPKRPYLIKRSFEASKKQKPAIAACLSRSFRSYSSMKMTRTEAQCLNLPVPESNLNAVCFIEETNTASSSYGQMSATPTKEIGLMENDNGFARTRASIELAPETLASTPAKLMTITPALHAPKRCCMSPDDNCTTSLNKLVRRPPCSKSLKFNTPVKIKTLIPDDKSTKSPNKMVTHPPCSRTLKFDTPVKNKIFNEELVLDDVSSDGDVCDVLSEDLLQSLRDKEKKAKRRRHMISSLPELFNMIHFLFQSMKYSFMKKEDLVEKIIFSHSDLVDEGEVEEQLKLLLELVPEWISEKLESGRDLLLIKINKMLTPESIRARLEEAK